MGGRTCHRVALLDAGGSAESRSEAHGEGSRPESAAPVPRVREQGASGGFGEVAGAGRLAGHP